MFKNTFINFSSEHHHAVQDDEPDRPPVKFVLAIVISVFIFIIFVWVAGYAILWKFTATEENTMNYGMADPNRLEYIKQQEDTLNSYKKTDAGFYQIPISSAMEKIVEQNKK